MKKVLFLSYFFPPLSGAASQRNRKLARYLRNQGWEPTIVCAQEDRGFPSDAGLMKGLEGLRIERVGGGFLTSKGRSSWRRRVARLLLAPDEYRLWVGGLRPHTDLLVKKEHFDLVYTSCGPFSLNGEGERLKKTHGLPWVTDFRDGWTLTPWYRRLTPLHDWVEERAEERAMSACDGFVANTSGLLDLQRRRFPVIADKCTVVANGFDPADFPPPERRAPGTVWEIGYLGTWYPRAYPPTIFQILRRFREKNPEKPLRFHYAGNDGAAVTALAAAYGVRDILTDHGALSHSDAAALLQKCDLFLLTLPLMESAEVWVPAKLYEYLAVGAPVLAACPPGDAAALIGQQGRVVAASGEKAIEEGRNYLEESWARWRGGKPVPLSAALSAHAYPVLAQRLAAFFNEVLSRRKAVHNARGGF